LVVTAYSYCKKNEDQDLGRTGFLSKFTKDFGL